MSSTGRLESPITVLCVDDEPGFPEMTAELLEESDDRFDVIPEGDPKAALDELDDEAVDCVVSDFDMPGLDGLEFLEQVRDQYPDLPFILFTGKGSEEIASEAVSAGVTDYLQKEGGTDQYTVLANRIDNAVSQYRAERTVERTREFMKLVEYSTDVISIVDGNGIFQFLTPSAERILGYEPDELVGESGFKHVHQDDREQAAEVFASIAQAPGTIARDEFRFEHPEDGWIWIEARARNMLDDPDISGIVVYSRDVTERKERERQNERLNEFASVVSHDLRNPLNVARGRLELLAETGDLDHVPEIEQAHLRMQRIIDDLLTLARQGERIEEPGEVSLEKVVRGAWANVETNGAFLDAPDQRTIMADESRLQQLLENLFRNAVEHGGDGVTVDVETTEDGFFIADDGEGIPEDERATVFESGYSTSEVGSGFGLTIVREIVDAHDWEINILESDEGGARFEVTDVGAS